MDWETFVRLSNTRVILALRKGKRFRNIAEQVCWPTLEILHFLTSAGQPLHASRRNKGDPFSFS
jgi:hypothetical protein